MILFFYFSFPGSPGTSFSFPSRPSGECIVPIENEVEFLFHQFSVPSPRRVPDSGGLSILFLLPRHAFSGLIRPRLSSLSLDSFGFHTVCFGHPFPPSRPMSGFPHCVTRVPPRTCSNVPCVCRDLSVSMPLPTVLRVYMSLDLLKIVNSALPFRQCFPIPFSLMHSVHNLTSCSGQASQLFLLSERTFELRCSWSVCPSRLELTPGGIEKYPFIVCFFFCLVYSCPLTQL